MRRSRMLALVTVVTAAAGLCAALAPTAGAAPASRTVAARSVPADLRVVQVRHSLLGTHTWYQQTFAGLPVYRGWYAVHDLAGGAVVDDGRRAVGTLPNATPRVSSVRAVEAAAAAGVRSTRSTLMVLPGQHARLAWVVDGTVDRAIVDAATGTVDAVTRTAQYVSGTGQVYDPNPVVALQRQSLRDRSDANSAVPAEAYRTVALRHLDPSGFLVGRWAQVVQAQGGLAESANERFVYRRGDDRFEQVMAYYAEDEVQIYLRGIGFAGPTGVNAEQQDLFVNTTAVDNSFYSPGSDRITFGTGGVDDAEDIEVIWHETGHAIQDDQVPGFGSTEQAGAIGEGFGDYLAMTMSMANSPDTARTPIECIADWDATSYTSTTPHCLRRTDTDKTTDDMTNEVHDDGEIWSRALRDINLALGREDADRVIIEAQFQFTPGTTFAAAAQKTWDTAKALKADLGLTTSQVAAVRQAFVDRKILAA